MSIKKGDIVGRISYKKDIMFFVDRIIRTRNSSFAILKGLNVRIEADAPVEDLEIFNPAIVKKQYLKIESDFAKRVNSKNLNKRQEVHTGRILHLDGDKRYSQKSSRYYEKVGLNATVKNVPENMQKDVVYGLLNKYKPDILVITGHDSMLKNGTNYNNIYNYRNSKNFIETVIEARKWQHSSDKLVIFARGLPELFRSNNCSRCRFCCLSWKNFNRFYRPNNCCGKNSNY